MQNNIFIIILLGVDHFLFWTMLLLMVHATLSNYVVLLCHHGKINVDVLTRVKSSKGLVVYNKENDTSFLTSMCNMNMFD
jgi:glutamate synthase domain-containing protein 2